MGMMHEAGLDKGPKPSQGADEEVVLPYCGGRALIPPF